MAKIYQKGKAITPEIIYTIDETYRKTTYISKINYISTDIQMIDNPQFRAIQRKFKLIPMSLYMFLRTQILHNGFYIDEYEVKGLLAQFACKYDLELETVEKCYRELLHLNYFCIVDTSTMYGFQVLVDRFIVYAYEEVNQQRKSRRECNERARTGESVSDVKLLPIPDKKTLEEELDLIEQEFPIDDDFSNYA
ncbi:hypothetical protein UAS_01931 [Enterococcus asini ATCC 700915]|uniref:Uncharacterized protein n=1 Tax=Enterococcus asini ATCC 700915 TaxID=1158606 RepID=R2PQQ5_9ENTE|nr:hypothetical protein [Enterococcus asini]EOH85638.1 hypothetical protein UAS_01931 [Enterococcus asini ATCC 700915]EOT57608.1 hypothetical protein I579_01159 [Enterococcus asini ATCC 700915]